MDERTNALPVGTELEGYRIVALLGAGGFGITYKAVDVLLDRPVAIKEYLPSILANRGQDQRTVRPFGRQEQEQFLWGLERFRSEAKTLVAFQHSNIVPVHRYFEANGTGYLVMSFQDGRNLADVIDAVGTLSEDELLTILRPLASGLADVHSKGFLHRDIKPANIIIRRNGTPVLIDFGAARQSVSRQSRGLTAIVTEGYAPYEQYETDSHQGPWTDIYALGAVLYHCVTGHRPPESPKRIAAQLRKQPDPMVAARIAAAGMYNDSVLSAIDRALEIEEAKRPQDVLAFMSIVDGWPLNEGAPAATAVPGDANVAVEPPSLPLGRRGQPPNTATVESDPDEAAIAEAAGNLMVDAPSITFGRRGRSAELRPRTGESAAAATTSMAPEGGATIIVGAGSDGPSRGWDADADTGDSATPRRRRSLVPLAAGVGILLLVGAAAAAYFIQRSAVSHIAAPPPQSPRPESTTSEAGPPPPKPSDAAAAKSKDAPPEQVWDRTLTKNGQDVVRRLFVLPNDEVLIVGGRVDAEAIGSDVWMWRFDAKEGKPSGDRRSFTNARFDSGNAVIRLSDGTLAMAAARRNPGNNAFVAWVARVSPTGDPQWQQSFAARALTIPYAIIAMPNGDVVVVGTAIEDEKAGTQGWAARISGDGKTVIWNRVFGKGPDDGLQAAAVLPDGGIVAVGWTNIDRAQNSDSNLWIVNLDADGKVRWEKRDVGDEADEKGKGVLVTDSGEIVILAEAVRERPQPPPTTTRPAQPAADATPVIKPWLLRLAPDGVVRWEQRFPGGRDDKSDSLDVIVPAGDGGFFLAGSTESRGAGRKDGWLVRIDAQGTKLWEKDIGTEFDDEFTALATLPDGGVLVGGGTAAKLDPPPGAPRPPRPAGKPEPAEAKLWLLRLGYKQ